MPEAYVSIDMLKELEERVKKIESKVGWAKEQEQPLIFPEEILEKLPSEVRKTVEGIMLNYDHDFPDFCFWGMRKALIDAIRIRFKRAEKENTLYDNENRAYDLPKWIELARQEKYISSDIASKLNKQVKVFGDVASHDYMADLHKEEVPSIFILLRLALSRMYYEKI